MALPGEFLPLPSQIVTEVFSLTLVQDNITKSTSKVQIRRKKALVFIIRLKCRTSITLGAGTHPCESRHSSSPGHLLQHRQELWQELGSLQQHRLQGLGSLSSVSSSPEHIHSLSSGVKTHTPVLLNHLLKASSE